jgi:hypothetical protein
MVDWQALLLIYVNLNVQLPGSWFARQSFQSQLAPRDIRDALHSFEAFPALARACSQGEVDVALTVARIERPLTSVTEMGAGMYWPSPTDTREELDELAPPGAFDSIFVLWPQTDPKTGATIPSGGWGLGMGASEWSNGATYATVANAPTEHWRRPRVGEVWLHEWLHGVCHHFAAQGFVMPDGDADGGSRHGYLQSAENGWCEFYCDLMTGNVQSGGQATGIPATAWRRGSICSNHPPFGKP